MLELQNNQLEFSFPEVHPEAKLSICFMRTLRLPDDARVHPLRSGLGNFPLCHVDDHKERVPAKWLKHGGVMLPMYQAEALWIFCRPRSVGERKEPYPFAVMVSAGKINAISGKRFKNELSQEEQDYLIVPKQLNLNGYCVDKGLVRQFVAMPLGSGYSAEEQLTGEAEHGGLQVVVYPIKADIFEKRFPKGVRPVAAGVLGARAGASASRARSAEMGLAAGGRIKQQIHADPFEFSDWDHSARSRCFVHICNSLMWREFAGTEPPTKSPTPIDYEQNGLPWFNYYDEKTETVPGSTALNGLKNIFEMEGQDGDQPLSDNRSVTGKKVSTMASKAKNPTSDGDS